MLEGEADLLINGRPPLHLKAGDSYTVPAGAIHDAKVSGDKPLKVLGIYIVDKTRPLASPAKSGRSGQSGAPIEKLLLWFDRSAVSP